MDITATWAQEIVMKPMEEMVVTNTDHYPKTTANTSASSLERKVRPQKEQALNCPRCNSTNTKFCYYNNYSLSQPRYFCKACRRYWTEGGSLRNIPVGGGSRKNKRSNNNSSSSTAASNYSASSSVTSSSKRQLPDLALPPPPATQQNPNCKILENSPQDLNLGFPATNPDHSFKSFTEMIQVPSFGSKEMLQNTSPPSANISALELLTGFTGSRAGLNNNSFMPLSINSNNNSSANINTGSASNTTDHHHHHHPPNGVYSTGFPLAAHHDQFNRPSHNFSLDGIGCNNYGSFQAVQETTNGKILFPFEDLKQVSSSVANHDGDRQENRDDQNAGDSSAGFWINGVMGGGSW